MQKSINIPSKNRIVVYYGTTNRGPYSGISITNTGNNDDAEVSLSLNEINDLINALQTAKRNIDFFGA